MPEIHLKWMYVCFFKAGTTLSSRQPYTKYMFFLEGINSILGITYGTGMYNVRVVYDMSDMSDINVPGE